MEKNWYGADNVNDFDSPAIFISPAIVKNNIKKLLEKISATHLRPHVKSNKIAEVCQLMMDAGISKFKAATIAEADMLGELKAPDVLLAYPPTVPKIKRLILLIQKYPDTKFSCIVDCMGTAKSISELFHKANLRADLYIDLNVGMNRTGVSPEMAPTLYQQIHSLPAINFLGLHAYDGHIKDSDPTLRSENCHRAFASVISLKETLEKISGKEFILIAGGTPTCFIHAAAGGRECSPGTFIFWDKAYAEQFPDLPFEWAAVVVSRVISIPSPGLICIDLGYKSVASESTPPRVHFLNVHDVVESVHSEEHLVLKAADSSKYKIGDVLYAVPKHICPTIALYDNVYIVENQHVSDSWKVVGRKRVNELT
jgi:D-threonine aldolase